MFFHGTPELMHCLPPSRAGLALGTMRMAWWLSAFFASVLFANAQAQSKETASAVAPSAVTPAVSSVARGLAIYTAKCSACHSVDENRVGPSHAGVLGRQAGKVKDYDYSEALTKSKVVWSRTNLERWLTDPEKVIPGQRMGYRLSLPQERADVVAYLASLSAPK